MKNRPILRNHQDGLVTVAALLFLIVLTIMGTSAISTSNMEVQIATNDEIHKMTFYAADGGADLGTELVELNVACPTGFASDDLDIGEINIVDSDFWLQQTGTKKPSDTDRDVRIGNDTGNHTNLSIFGQTAFGIGGAIEMAAAYEGRGKAAASGGVTLNYEIYSQHQGFANSESIIALHWQHVVGSEGACQY
ncbi:hypothetical protein JY97_01680 [Alkalispirochaeta odontotermitis]|nr:hypothetical protein JY97_01680 [Alkalispirochaeta odontotermitis]CAB1081981.1 hypothetical protein D1AOALGA4SA_9621 [Olavius algarvensis Delta 1 endosymbiont]